METAAILSKHCNTKRKAKHLGCRKTDLFSYKNLTKLLLYNVMLYNPTVIVLPDMLNF